MPKAEKLTEAAVRFLQEKHIAHFVTLMTDGSPQVTPVWVDVDADGSHVLINSSEGRVKTRNAARDPRVAVSVLDEQDPFKFVIVRGKRSGAQPRGRLCAHRPLGKEVHRRGALSLQPGGGAAGDPADQTRLCARAGTRLITDAIRAGQLSGPLLLYS